MRPNDQYMTARPALSYISIGEAAMALRFGKQLELWLDFLGLRKSDFEGITGMKAEYFGALARGSDSPTGIEKPGPENQKKIFNGLTKRYGKRVDNTVFWQGPPAPGFQQAAAISDRSQSGAAPHVPLKIDLIEVLERAHTITAEGAELTPEDRRALIERIAGYVAVKNRNR